MDYIRNIYVSSFMGNPGPRIHGISIHVFPKIHGYENGYPWFLDDSLQLYAYKCGYSYWYSKQGYPCKDILLCIYCRMSLQQYQWIDTHVLWISVFNYPCSYGYLSGYPWIPIDTHALTCYGLSIQGSSASSLDKYNYVMSYVRKKNNPK